VLVALDVARGEPLRHGLVSVGHGLEGPEQQRSQPLLPLVEEVGALQLDGRLVLVVQDGTHLVVYNWKANRPALVDKAVH
jgi:hypothetical protein